MKTILFQGDSITDANRNRERDTNMGSGYATMVAGVLGYEHPGAYRVLNRGVSGDRVVDLYARMKSDIVNLNPDVVSILIGINDVCHEIDGQNGVDAEKYFMVYCMLVEELQQALPKVKIIIMEPFVLKEVCTEAQTWEVIDRETRLRAQKAKEVAEKYGLPFVELQKQLDEASKLTPNGYWLSDGVHPTAAGHALLKEQWLKTFRTVENY